jgi:hypothetical protein
LAVLKALPDPVVASTVNQLITRAEKMQMHISKWDIYKCLQINMTEIKKVLQWLTLREDPTQISTHLFAVALILTREWEPSLKLDRIFNLICCSDEMSLSEFTFIQT